MDQERRELQRKAATGDPQAQEKLENIQFRLGNPSWKQILVETERVQQLQKTHLFKAVEAGFQHYFEKHPDSGVTGFSWGIFPRPDCSDWQCKLDNWDVEGLSVVIDGAVWEDPCRITSYGGLDTDASILIAHLKGVCNCESGGKPLPGGECFIGNFEWLGNSEKKQAFCSALEDAILLFEMLDKTPRTMLHPDAEKQGQFFEYRPVTGLTFTADTKQETTTT